MLRPKGCTGMRSIIDALIGYTVMNSIVLIRIIELLGHDYIYVICSSCATLVSVLARVRARLHVYMFTSHHTLTLDSL